MVYIPQKQLENLEKLLCPNKVIIIYGARRVGKTTLLHKFLEKQKDNQEKILFINGDDIIVRQFLESQSINKLKEFVGNNTLLIIDEAQYISQVGLNLKLIVDHIQDIKVIATGSSSFELAKDIGEPLTGRKYTLKLFPLAQMEIGQIENRHETQSNLESRIIYGSYPEIVIMNDNQKRKEYLKELISSYLFKDILALEGIKHSKKLLNLLQLIAFQIGKEVSHNELGKQLGMSKNTVERYLDLLQKVFVIFKRNGFSRNIRKEITKSPRYYFYDNGIRNALIANFNPLNLRNDKGQLWENYIAVELLKKQEYRRIQANNYFWRTYDKKEIDIIEERDGKLFAYEIKWQTKKTKPPKEWEENYPNSEFNVINNENYLDFIL
ncbi:MAG: ATP-binding protein [Candidatus Cloacimonetes bacterium]|nr:ATP-binding protein [Candidatus Cloacimonadota bacterium]